VLGHSFYKSRYLVNGVRERKGFELRFRPGPASFKYESMKMTEERLGVSVEDKDLSPLLSKAWYASGTIAVTGETKADGLDEPKRPLFKGGVGASRSPSRGEHLVRRIATRHAGRAGVPGPQATSCSATPTG
jgi:hypothetical protein